MPARLTVERGGPLGTSSQRASRRDRQDRLVRGRKDLPAGGSCGWEALVGRHLVPIIQVSFTQSVDSHVEPPLAASPCWYGVCLGGAGTSLDGDSGA